MRVLVEERLRMCEIVTGEQKAELGPSPGVRAVEFSGRSL